MRRLGRLDNLKWALTPRERIRDWVATLFEFFGLAALGWTLGTTIVELFSGAGFLRLLVAGLGLAIVVMWVRWRSWPRGLYGVGISIIVLTVGAPLVRYFLP
jgi:hypothetical protein